MGKGFTLAFASSDLPAAGLGRLEKLKSELLESAMPRTHYYAVEETHALDGQRRLMSSDAGKRRRVYSCGIQLDVMRRHCCVHWLRTVLLAAVFHLDRRMRAGRVLWDVKSGQHNSTDTLLNFFVTLM
jgi:hypothetical protein